jgi:hypothetical protein
MSGYLVTRCKNQDCGLDFRVQEQPVTVLGRLVALRSFPKEFQCPRCRFEMWIHFEDVRIKGQ